MTSESPPKSDPAAKAESAPSGDLLAAANEQQKRFRDAADKIRSRADLTAKGLGALGTTVLTAIGITKVGDLFPAKAELRWLVGVAFVLVGFAAMTFVLGFFTRRLWRVNEPIFLAADEKRMPDLDKHSPKGTTPELDRVTEIYGGMADLNDVPSLRAYELRGHRWERIAERERNEKRAKELQIRAALLRAEVLATETRALAVLVRDRASRAIADSRAVAAYAAFVIGVVLFAAGADWLESNRTDEVALARSCGDARKAGATELPDPCTEFNVMVEAGGVTETPNTTTGGGSGGQPTPQGSQALLEAMRAASVLATTLNTAVDGAKLPAETGRKILEGFLTEVGFPLTKDGIKAVAGALWRRYVEPDGEPVADLTLESTVETMRIVVIVRNNQRPVVRVVPIRKHR